MSTAQRQYRRKANLYRLRAGIGVRHEKRSARAVYKSMCRKHHTYVRSRGKKGRGSPFR